MTDETRRKIANALRPHVPWPAVFVNWPVYRLSQLRWSMVTGPCTACDRAAFLFCNRADGLAVCIRCWWSL